MRFTYVRSFRFSIEQRAQRCRESAVCAYEDARAGRAAHLPVSRQSSVVPAGSALPGSALAAGGPRSFQGTVVSATRCPRSSVGAPVLPQGTDDTS